MGLRRIVSWLRHPLGRLGDELDAWRICRFEQMEPRQLLSADIQLGAVYYEDAGGDDDLADTLQVAWKGGQPGTQLTRLVINTDKLEDGLTIGDTFFDVAAGGVGAYGAAPLRLVSHDGFTVTSIEVADGGTMLVMTFAGFDAGEKLVFTIDVDEQGFLGPNAVAEGNEFEGSRLAGTFAAPHFFDVAATDIFRDAYDSRLAASGLDLPPDSYQPPGNVPSPVRTAGAFFPLRQTPLPISIAGMVYEDRNVNNSHGAGEPGIAGVQLALFEFRDGGYAATGRTATTDAAGNYRFDSVLPGKYRIVETQPAGYFSVGARAGTVNGSTRGVATSPDVLSEITLLGGEDSVRNDFAEALPSTIRGRVHADADGDCQLDSGEKLLAGVTIRLLDAGGSAVATTTTNQQGEYEFSGLPPGAYTVVEVQPAGYFDADDHVGSAGGRLVPPDSIAGIVLTSGTLALDYNFCEHEPVSLAGRVYVDDNDNGAIDGGEPGIGGVALRLLDAQGQSLGISTVTAADGSYQFSGLAPGVYGIEEVQPAGFYDGRDTAGSAGGTAQNPGDRITAISLTPGVHGRNYDFGELRPASIRGLVHADRNGDCLPQPGEPAIAGVTVQLLDSAGNVLATTTTNAEGRYAFENLAPGTYGIRELQPAGYFDSDERVGSAGGTRSANDQFSGIRLGSGARAIDYNFCEHEPASISGRVYVDDNDNGAIDGGEAGIGGVTLRLLDAQGRSLSTTTVMAADGSYQFSGLAPGVYGVEEIQPAGFYDGRDTAGSAGGTPQNPGDRITLISLAPAVNAVNYNFGELRPASIRGLVHADRNGDCILQPGEPAIAVVTVQLLDSAGNVLATTTTNAEGRYAFENLAPGTYGVRELHPAGYFDSDEHVGSAGGTRSANDQFSGIRLGSGARAIDYNFCEHEPASVSGRVYVDDNDNGAIDGGEAGIGGVTVRLVDSQGRSLTAVTAADGSYHFGGLAPGTYAVHELQPAGFYDGRDTAGSAGGTAHNPGDRITGISLAPAVNAVNYNFGELRPASIRGLVHADLDGDCLIDPGEPPLAGVVVELLGAGGAVVARTTTGTDGRYQFDNLAPGSYGLRELQPAGYFDGAERVGSAGGSIVDNDVIAGISLAAGVDAVGYDFCELPPAAISGYVFQDGGPIELESIADELPGLPARLHTLRTGQRKPGDLPIPGVTLRLADASGALLLDSSGRPIEAVTNSQGFYLFTGLPPGLYTVIQVQPSGYVDGLDTAGSLGGFAINPAVIDEGGIDLRLVNPLLLSIAGTDAIAAIPLGPGQHSLENNFSEVRVIELPDVPLIMFPPTPTLPPIEVPLPQAREPALPPLLTLFVAPIVQPFLDGGHAGGYTWHLSVIDAGSPRGQRGSSETRMHLTSVRFDAASWQSTRLNEGQWTVAAETGQPRETRRLVFGKRGGIPVSGDFDGDGVTEVGIFIDGQWFIDLNGNGEWDEDDLWIKLGSRGDLPVTGDWDGDGKTDVGVFGRAWPGDPRAVAAEPGLPDPQSLSTGPRKNMPPPLHQATLGWRAMKRSRDGDLRADLIDHVFHYGSAGDIPVAGDFNGDGIDTIGVFRDGRWVLDVDGDGKWSDGDLSFHYGAADDLPVVGDFNGDGVDEIGFYRRGVWRLDTDNDRRLDDEDQLVELGGPDDRPVTGDFNGDGADEIALYHEQSAAPDEL